MSVDLRQSGVFRHTCKSSGCTRVVTYDDEPYCFEHSPDEGSSRPGFSARREHDDAFGDEHDEACPICGVDPEEDR
jgi:hypothetical protein